MRVWIILRKCRVQVLADDTKSPEVIVDLVISSIGDEVLISDKLISELGIALEDVGKGLWRFRWEPKDRVRKSEPPQYWR